MLTATNISLNAGSKKLLINVNAHFGAGKLVGIMGPNGAGKSSLLKVLCAVLPAQEGRILLHDKPLSIKESAKHIAYLPDSGASYWPLTVEQIIALGRIPHRRFLSRFGKEDGAAIKDALEQTALLRLRHRVFSTLSHGEQMRVMLARAFATQASVILLDEPLGGLDAKYQLALMHLLKEKTRAGCAIAMVLHDFSLAQRFCNEILLMNRATVVMQDIPDKVLTHTQLKEVFHIDVAIGRMHGVPFVVPV